ncbi:sugar ABC transporter permease [Streptomyces lomondensis]|uniref:Xylose transport system permease protein XylH n=1 Tax=Streptomyces lomondensis TaxID=68229 RepID=A0ABQ2XA40_9ACTN|nr:sugar ABC transporter permease [Streptomyces lomondensis]MCF0077084.1 sugar ABC transporter permease [Streptomyces lomondensis]GGX06844.1 ABC transporter permease [Streptomyces lomondensis]
MSRGGPHRDGGPAGPVTTGRRPRARGWQDNLREYASDVRGSVRDGERGPLLVVAGLIVICVVFQILDDKFLSPRNLSNLSVDIVGTGLVAVGIVFVLLIREIDLSVGSVSGLAGAAFAVLNVNHGVPEWLAVIVAVVAGTAVGAFHGFFFAWLGVPAFVVTLAGLLVWNGLTLYLLGASGTINIDEEGLVASLTSRHFGADAAAYAVAALGTAGYLLTARRRRSRHRAAGMPYRPMSETWLRTALLAVVAFAAAHTLNRFQGLPLALLIFLVVLVVSDYVLRRTRYGRRVYALGGGVEAARRAGIAVERVRVAMFMVSGTLAAVGGLFVASGLTSASPTTARAAGSGMLLINAIAAAVIGGTSLFGGRGSPWSVLLGVLVIHSIASGMGLLGVQDALQFMITGGVLLAAVAADALSRRAQARRGRP